MLILQTVRNKRRQIKLTTETAFVENSKERKPTQPHALVSLTRLAILLLPLLSYPLCTIPPYIYSLLHVYTRTYTF